MPEKDEVVQQFLSLQTLYDVADILNITEGKLNYCLYLLNPKYTNFEIAKKSGGVRLISAPHLSLKLIQRKLAEILNEVYEPKNSVHGFVSGRNIKTNAHEHKKKKYVLNLDLKDFFPSIHFGRVRGMFQSAPFNLPEKVATILARVCCTYEGLPQGAPSSPVVSNMICRKLDTQLQRLAKKHKCFYTRYADDITFSTQTPDFPEALADFVEGSLIVGQELSKIIKDNGFTINPHKIRLQTPGQRQEVTGLVVNQRVNINRQYIRQVRVMLHDWRTLNPEKALDRHLRLHKKHHKPGEELDISFNQIVRGKIEFVRMILGEKNPVYHSLASQLAELDPKFAKKYVPLNIKIFLSYAREDQSEVAKIDDMLKLAKYESWMDKENITGGDEWEQKIYSGIDKCHIFIACLPKEPIGEDRFVWKEIERALERYNGDGNLKIIPLRLNECKLPSNLNKFHCIDYYKSDGWEALKSSIVDPVDVKK